MWMRQAPQTEQKQVNLGTEVGIPTVSAAIIFLCVSVYVFMVFEMARVFALWLPSLVLALGVTVAEAIIFYKWEFSQMILRQISMWLRKPTWVTVCAIFLITFLIVGIAAFFTLAWWIDNATTRQEVEICLGIGFIVGSAPLVFFFWMNIKDPWFPAPRYWQMPEEQQQSKRLLVWPGTSVKEGEGFDGQK
jgi:hypothetical protein